MRKIFYLKLVLLVCLFGFFVAGCEEESASDSKKYRLVGAENLELKNKIIQLEGRLKKETANLRKELIKKDVILEQCGNNLKMLMEQLSAKNP